MSLAEELAALRKRVRVKEKDIRRLKEANAFSPQAVGSQQRSKNEIPCTKDDRRRGKRETRTVLPHSESKPARILSVFCPAKSTLEVLEPGGGHAGAS